MSPLRACICEEFYRVVSCVDESRQGVFTNISLALQNNLAKIYNARNHIYSENFKLKLCMCAQRFNLKYS